MKGKVLRQKNALPKAIITMLLIPIHTICYIVLFLYHPGPFSFPSAPFKALTGKNSPGRCNDYVSALDNYGHTGIIDYLMRHLQKQQANSESARSINTSPSKSKCHHGHRRVSEMEKCIRKSVAFLTMLQHYVRVQAWREAVCLEFAFGHLDVTNVQAS